MAREGLGNSSFFMPQNSVIDPSCDMTLQITLKYLVSKIFHV